MDRQVGSGLAGHSVDERLPLALLTAREAFVERVVDGRDLPRFNQLCEPQEGIRVRLSFSPDENDNIRIDGVLASRLSVPCHRCLEAVSVELITRFSVVGVTSDAEAARLAARQDVLQLVSDEPTLAELIEDELILALPQKPCAEENCDKAPPVAYPRQTPEKDNPFRSLALLKE